MARSRESEPDAQPERRIPPRPGGKGARCDGYNFAMQLIDIGLNLSHDSFDRDRNAVWQRARDAGVAMRLAQAAATALGIGARGGP